MNTQPSTAVPSAGQSGDELQNLKHMVLMGKSKSAGPFPKLATSIMQGGQRALPSSRDFEMYILKVVAHYVWLDGGCADYLDIMRRTGLRDVNRSDSTEKYLDSHAYHQIFATLPDLLIRRLATLKDKIDTSGRRLLEALRDILHPVGEASRQVRWEAAVRPDPLNLQSLAAGGWAKWLHDLDEAGIMEAETKGLALERLVKDASSEVRSRLITIQEANPGSAAWFKPVCDMIDREIARYRVLQEAKDLRKGPDKEKEQDKPKDKPRANNSVPASTAVCAISQRANELNPQHVDFIGYTAAAKRREADKKKKVNSTQDVAVEARAVAAEKQYAKLTRDLSKAENRVRPCPFLYGIRGTCCKGDKCDWSHDPKKAVAHAAVEPALLAHPPVSHPPPAAPCPRDEVKGAMREAVATLMARGPGF